MVFSSYSFLLLFLPAVLLCYFLTPQRLRPLRNGVLLAFSLGFYFFGEPKGILVLLGVVGLCYVCALVIAGTQRLWLRRLGLLLAIAGAMGTLCYYKYIGFFATNLNHVLGLQLAIPEIVMPIGISFFTFQAVSYVIDVYRREAPAQKNPLYVALYVSLFPQLVAGPIVRYGTVAQELTCRRESWDGFVSGMGRFVIGLGKKLLLANVFGQVAETLFSLEQRSAVLAWAGALFYALQIFYDFAGYSDMAIGLGEVFGFHFSENFRYPYVANSITDFWRRWHISLSTWFRDYVYIPLGGNRKGLPRQLLNLLIVWGLTGFWHGASWNFLLWGLYFAVILMAEKLFLLKLLEKLPKVFRHLYALVLILIGWVIFNCTTMPQLSSYLSSLVRVSTVSGNDWHYLWFLCRQYGPEILLGLACCTPVFSRLYKRYAAKPWFMVLAALCLVGIFALCLLNLSASSFNPFIYFRF